MLKKMGCALSKRILTKNENGQDELGAQASGLSQNQTQTHSQTNQSQQQNSKQNRKQVVNMDEVGDFSKIQDDPRMPLNVRQIFKITKSWKAIARTMSRTGTIMFLNLFEQNEDLLNLFTRFQHLKGQKKLQESMELQEHAATVMSTLDQSINSLNNYDNFVTYLHSIGKLHRKVPGFKKSYFWEIEQPFLKAVKQTLDERCNETIEQIYILAIKFIITTIMDGFGDDNLAGQIELGGPTSEGPESSGSRDNNQSSGGNNNQAGSNNSGNNNSNSGANNNSNNQESCKRNNNNNKTPSSSSDYPVDDCTTTTTTTTTPPPPPPTTTTATTTTTTSTTTISNKTALTCINDDASLGSGDGGCPIMSCSSVPESNQEMACGAGDDSTSRRSRAPPSGAQSKCPHFQICRQSQQDTTAKTVAASGRPTPSKRMEPTVTTTANTNNNKRGTCPLSQLNAPISSSSSSSSAATALKCDNNSNSNNNNNNNNNKTSVVVSSALTNSPITVYS